jgi:hypothetical protein
MGIVVEETDEIVSWLELIAEGHLVPSSRLADLQKEANELLALFAASQHTAKSHGTETGHFDEPMSRWTDEPMIG